MKKAYGLLLILMLVLAACGNEDSSSSEAENSGDAKTIKLAHSGSETHQYHIAAAKFKEILESNEDVDFTVEIHPNSSLGSEGDAIEQVVSGSVEMTTVAADSNLANIIPEMNVFGIPYIFDDKEHVYNALDGEAGQHILDLAEDKGMKGLGYWEVGMRHITNDSRELIKPEDVSGLSIRVQPAKVWENHITALDGSPTPVDFNELYSALDQGVIDAQENPLATIDSMNLYEVQDYISLTEHTYTPAVTLMNLDFYENLSDTEVEALESAVEEATEYQRNYLDEQEDEILTMLEEEGVTISEPDRDAFREATSDVADSVSNDVPEEIVQSLIDSK
jgi:tripartite ATP-independent transporter DctP family solute receptor